MINDDGRFGGKNGYDTLYGWIGKRVNSIKEYFGTDFFKNKTLLELGAGCGDIGNLFYEMGARVFCIEGQNDNIRILKIRYPHLYAYRTNLNNGLGTTKHFDIILHMGTLYHLYNAEQSLIDCCNQCDYLVLESEMIDLNEELLTERVDGTDYQHSLDCRGSSISISKIEKILKNSNMKYERIINILDHGAHRYNWQPKNSGLFGSNYRALWICKKQQ